MAKDTKFWMVKGNGPTSYCHSNEKDAMIEAERLARSNPGQAFYILEATRVVRKTDVVWDNLDDSVDVPF